MGRFDLTPEQIAKWRSDLEASVAPHLNGEEVLAVAGFRRGGNTAQLAASKLGGGLVYAAVALVNKKKAGGLPEQVLLALTPERLYAFGGRPAGYGFKIKKEAAVWNRADLTVSTSQSMGLTMLMIESVGEGEKATLAPIGVKNDALGLELIEQLQSGAAAPA